MITSQHLQHPLCHTSGPTASTNPSSPFAVLPSTLRLPLSIRKISSITHILHRVTRRAYFEQLSKWMVRSTGGLSWVSDGSGGNGWWGCRSRRLVWPARNHQVTVLLLVSTTVPHQALGSLLQVVDEVTQISKQRFHCEITIDQVVFLLVYNSYSNNGKIPQKFYTVLRCDSFAYLWL